MDSTIIDRYRKIQNGYNSSSKKETDLYELKKQITLHFGNSIDYEKNSKVNNVTQKLIVVHTDKEIKKNIIAYPNETFKIGSIVNCYDMNWLITKVDANKQVYTIGEITQSQLQLKWQNSSGQIISRYAVVEKATNPNLNENNIITTSQKQYSIKLPFDSETQNLYMDKRFLTDIINGKPQARKIVKIDAMSENYGDMGGIINITLEDTEFNPQTDNAEMMIANYFSPAPPHIGNAKIIYTGQPTIYIGGSYKIFSAEFKDSNGNVLNLTPVWTWSSISSQTDKFNVEINGNTFKIKASLDASLIGSKIKIILEDSGKLYHTEQLVEVIDY